MKLVFLFFTLMFAVPEVTALIQKEYRILLPYSLEQFRNGYLWTVAESSLYETGGDEGVEIIINEPSDSMVKQLGLPAKHFTHRVLHLAKKVPRFVRILAPKGSLEVPEKSWDAFPYVYTEYSNAYMKSGFYVKITTKYVDNDDCRLDNVFLDKGLTPDSTDELDICRNEPENAKWDPTQCYSEKLNIAPLTSGWRERNPHMCVYSFVEIQFEWWGLQDKVEKIIQKASRNMFTKTYRQMFCWADQWAGLTLEEVRQKERLVKVELDWIRSEGEVRGLVIKR